MTIDDIADNTCGFSPVSAQPLLRGVALLGGSFNPVHYGHLRLALEVQEELCPERLDIIPCANPPHKPVNDLLPFALRVDLLREAFSVLPKVRVNTLEGERQGLSFTCDTLAAYQAAEAGIRHFFVMGGSDLENFDKWKNWRHCPCLADLVVAARAGAEEEAFRRDVRRLWPDAQECVPPSIFPDKPYPAYRLPLGGHIVYMSLPRLDVSASLLRARWLQGRSVHFWTPDAVINILENNQNTVRRCWSIV